MKRETRLAAASVQVFGGSQERPVPSSGLASKPKCRSPHLVLNFSSAWAGGPASALSADEASKALVRGQRFPLSSSVCHSRKQEAGLGCM